MEKWKDVVGYEGYYQVSNLGNVKSIKRFDSIGRLVKEKMVKQFPNSGGYMQVGLHKNGFKSTQRVHILVSIAFLNHKQDGMNRVVDHIDNNKLNNSVSNLQITTQRHNATKDRKGSSSYVGVFFNKANKNWCSSIRIDGIKKHLGSFKTEKEAADEYQKHLIKLNK